MNSGQSVPMSTTAEGTPAREPGRWQAARIIRTIAWAIAIVIAIGIAFVVLDANQDNGIVTVITDIGSFFVEPFKGIFSLDDAKGQVALNWGIGAVVYVLVGHLIARLVAR